jgi:hypothetical protein
VRLFFVSLHAFLFSIFFFPSVLLKKKKKHRLPDELRLHVFRYLSFEDYKNLSVVNKELRRFMFEKVLVPIQLSDKLSLKWKAFLDHSPALTSKEVPQLFSSFPTTAAQQKQNSFFFFLFLFEL